MGCFGGQLLGQKFEADGVLLKLYVTRDMWSRYDEILPTWTAYSGLSRVKPPSSILLRRINPAGVTSQKWGCWSAGLNATCISVCVCVCAREGELLLQRRGKGLLGLA